MQFFFAAIFSTQKSVDLMANFEEKRSAGPAQTGKKYALDFGALSYGAAKSCNWRNEV
jgi:hypothetical protein